MADVLAYAAGKWGQKYVEAQELFRREYGTLANIVSIAKRVPFSRRRENLTFTHHEAVASLPPAEQEKFLDQAEQFNLTVSQLREATRTGRKEATEEEKPDSSDQLLIWFGDGARLIKSADRWTAAQRRAFVLQWRQLAESVKSAGLTG